ncbi:hypothetical protein A3863_07620 (plasmid) [Priestia endophytica]|uniref:hypothetical protein n=1 Tax=Priestia endophytica TaxID=135735 RepID=UPI000DCA954A|nr:hypothetical protein [Priestia endophytica]RAS90844.1 hypothetical protein A3863_07620 [Priestia endophytica]
MSGLRDYLIRLITGLVTFFLILGIADWFDIKWIQEGSPTRILPIVLIVSWVIFYFFKKRD